MKKTKLLINIIIVAMAILSSCTTSSTTSTNVTSTTSTSSETQTFSAQNGEQKITLNNQNIEITSAGTYTLTGNIDNGQIIVDIGEDQKATIKLAGVNVNNSTSSAFYIKSGKITIEIVDGTENIFSDGKIYSDTSDDAPNSAIYANEDLTITGNGKLTVNGNYNDGITTKDDLVIENGNIFVNSADDGIRGKDSVTINNGKITINSKGDGIKSDHETKGNIVVNNGEINIDAGSDGMEAYISLTINNGNVNISNSVEGLESEKIIINDGNVNIKSSDDGINVSSSSTSSSDFSPMHGGSTIVNEDIKLTINGGNIVVDASGDGLDANGSIEVNGGKIVVYGPTNNGNAALDYDATMAINGGEVVAFGTSGMAQNASTISTQNTILINLNSTHSSSENFKITDSSGNVIFEGNSLKNYNSVLVSNSSLKTGETYNYSVGSETGNFTISTIINSAGQTRGMGGPGGMRGGRMMPF